MQIELMDDWPADDPWGVEQPTNTGPQQRVATGYFANALQVWSALQALPPTVGRAAEAFCVDPDQVRHAVGQHPWMFLDGDVIAHDGE